MSAFSWNARQKKNNNQRNLNESYSMKTKTINSPTQAIKQEAVHEFTSAKLTQKGGNSLTSILNSTHKNKKRRFCTNRGWRLEWELVWNSRIWQSRSALRSTPSSPLSLFSLSLSVLLSFDIESKRAHCVIILWFYLRRQKRGTTEKGCDFFFFKE